jgi:hypothetical protein
MVNIGLHSTSRTSLIWGQSERWVLFNHVFVVFNLGDELITDWCEISIFFHHVVLLCYYVYVVENDL